MKKFLLLIPGMLLPYIVLIASRCVPIFDNVILLLFAPVAVFAIAFICNLIFFALAIIKKSDAKQTALFNMLVKLIQIPAYVLIFGFGLIFAICPFTFGFTFAYIVFDLLSIFLSGITGIAALFRCYREGKCSDIFAILNGFLQFTFCADVVSAVIVYRKAAAGAKQNYDFSRNIT